MSKPKLLTVFDNGSVSQGYTRLGNKVDFTLTNSTTITISSLTSTPDASKLTLLLTSGVNYTSVSTIIVGSTSYPIKDLSGVSSTIDSSTPSVELLFINNTFVQLNTKSNKYIEQNFPKLSNLSLTPPYISGVYDTLEEYSWSDIDEISKAGLASTYFSVGDTKNLTINNATYPVQIIGFAHDNLADGSGKAGITFQMVDCLAATGGMNLSNINGTSWNDSYMRLYNLQRGCNITQFDEECFKKIKLVSKITSAGDTSSTLITTSDKLFLPSEIEIFGSTTYSFAGEGSQYAYYSAGNSKVKNVNGSAYFWWERSPSSGNAAAFCLVYSNGSANRSNASNSYGVSFCFCI